MLDVQFEVIEKSNKTNGASMHRCRMPHINGFVVLQVFLEQVIMLHFLIYFCSLPGMLRDE